MPRATTKLINRSGRLKTYVLPHDQYCELAGECRCQLTNEDQPRLVPGTLTIPADSYTVLLPDAILQVPVIIKAIAAGELGVTRRLPRKVKKAK